MSKGVKSMDKPVMILGSEIKESEFAEARALMAKHISGPATGLKQVYKSNISMKIWDMACINGKRKLSAVKCNEIAEELLKLIFQD